MEIKEKNIKGYIFNINSDENPKVGISCVEMTSKMTKGKDFEFVLSLHNGNRSKVLSLEDVKGGNCKNINIKYNKNTIVSSISEIDFDELKVPDISIKSKEFTNFFTNLKDCDKLILKGGLNHFYFSSYIGGKSTSQGVINHLDNTCYYSIDYDDYPYVYCITGKNKIILFSKLSTVAENLKINLFFLKDKFVIEVPILSAGRIFFTFHNESN